MKKADKAKQLAITDALTKNQSSVVSEPIEDEVKQNQANAELAPAKEMANSEEMP
ncbi:MAG: hypothetical protein PHV02_09440 [Rhodocyclaceae bacterium]|nr:hypothetical protein [Rhodocyclaceae bacterium]